MAKFKRLDVDTDDFEGSIDEEIALLERDVYDAAKQYAKLDKAEKTAANAKSKEKKRFNDAATRLLELTRPLSRKTVVADYEELHHGFGVDEWIATNHPGYRVLDMERDPEKMRATIVLEEDPALMKFHTVVDGKVVGRTTSQAADEFDAESYLMEDPARRKALVKTTMVYELDDEAAERFLAKNPEELATMQAFTTPGKITIKMNPVRKANEDD